MSFQADEMCFACGKDNPIGLHLTFIEDDEYCRATFISERNYQGYEGIIHGGIIATLLDEVMARFAWKKYGSAATAKLEVRYLKPAPTGVPIHLRSHFVAVKRNGKIFEMAAIATLADGTLLAEGSATVMKINKLI